MILCHRIGDWRRHLIAFWLRVACIDVLFCLSFNSECVREQNAFKRANTLKRIHFVPWLSSLFSWDQRYRCQFPEYTTFVRITFILLSGFNRNAESIMIKIDQNQELLGMFTVSMVFDKCFIVSLTGFFFLRYLCVSFWQVKKVCVIICSSKRHVSYLMMLRSQTIKSLSEIFGNSP